MKWRCSFYKDCLYVILEGFWEGFTKGIAEDITTLVFVALALLGLAIVIYFGG